MKTCAACPVCGGKLGFWTVFQALTPFRLRCPRCKTKLKVVLRGLWVLFLTIGSLLLILGLGVAYAYRRYGLPSFLLGILALLLLWALIEVSMAILFFNKASFVEVAKKKAP